MRHSQAIGSAFEYLVDYMNDQYKTRQIAIINKRATPMKILGKPLTTGRFQTYKATFESKSTVDYDGVYKGKAIAFDAKTLIKDERFAWKRLELHQFEHMKLVQEHGGVAFLLIEFQKVKSQFILPYPVIAQFYLNQSERGTKSISLADVEANGIRVDKGRVPMDYLAAVDQYLQEAKTE